MSLERSKKEAKKFIKFNETNPVIYFKNNINQPFANFVLLEDMILKQNNKKENKKS